MRVRRPARTGGRSCALGEPASARLHPSPRPSPAAAYPACRAWQLTGRPGRSGPTAGTVYQEVRLTNHSGLPCTLSGGPSAVTGVRADGSLVALASVADGGVWNLVGPGPANLRPGQSGWVTLAYADGCPALVSGGRAGYKTLLSSGRRPGTGRVPGRAQPDLRPAGQRLRRAGRAARGAAPRP